MQKSSYLATLFLALLCLSLLIGLGMPCFELLHTAFFPNAEGTVNLFSKTLLRATGNTLFCGSIVALISTLLGFICAYAIVCCRIAGKGLLNTLFLAPLFAPSIMPAMGLIYLFGNYGLIYPTELYGLTGIIVGSVIFSLPHTTLQILINLQSLDRQLLDAASLLGASSYRRLTSIVLPHIRTGLLNAALLAFVLTITDFGVPKILGGNFPVLATEIYKFAIGLQDFQTAALLSLWLMLPSLIAFYAGYRLKNGNTQKHYTLKTFAPKASCARDITFSVLAWGITLFTLSSILIVVFCSFIRFWPYEPVFTWQNFLLRDTTYGLKPWMNSLILALSTALLGTFFAFSGSYLSTRYKNVSPLLQRLYNSITTLPLCIPGTVLGLGFVFAFNNVSFFSGALGSMVLIVFNTTLHLYTVAHVMSANGLAQIDKRFETVGRTLGRGVPYTFFRVICPLSTRTLAEIFCYLFSGALTSISALVFLYTPDNIVAAVAAIQSMDAGYFSQGAAMASLLFLSNLVMRGGIQYFFIRKR